ncbi:hypothetical protein PoB_006051600 [Plakobranchus ocellatus]|uniref:Uncharacterized protein n=1 Tax=Plakobranchus ocellatus TaxID=259542 RepID=A0AAV4CQ84_9GAST|nr:hypothetical protein PoB_006051600 [Plakobranchus ocellatus]
MCGLNTIPGTPHRWEVYRYSWLPKTPAYKTPQITLKVLDAKSGQVNQAQHQVRSKDNSSASSSSSSSQSTTKNRKARRKFAEHRIFSPHERFDKRRPIREKAAN